MNVYRVPKASFVLFDNSQGGLFGKHGQYEAVELLLTVVESNSQREKISKSIQESLVSSGLLLPCPGTIWILSNTWGRFFRASCVRASRALLDSSRYTGLPHLDVDGSIPSAAWKFHYYQWAIQLFEQYNVSEGAYQFALAALEQVDEPVIQKDIFYGTEIQNESATTVKGRLWANVFKFTLDLNLLRDAYCSILSNPDYESKYICLRRFLIVLYEQEELKVLCDGQLPFIGLAEKIEQELAWKADRSDIFMEPSPYKLLSTFEMRRHNWRKAADYMYQYSVRLRSEGILKDQQHMSLVLQERKAERIICYHQCIQQNLCFSSVNIKWNFSGTDNEPADLVETYLYDMTFTVLLKIWKGSCLKRANGLLLASSVEETGVHGSPDIGCASHQLNGKAQWETLELYLRKITRLFTLDYL